MIQQTNLVYLRWPQVYQKTGLSRSTVWRLEQAGEFPKRRQLSTKAVAWLAHEIEAWIQSRIRLD